MTEPFATRTTMVEPSTTGPSTTGPTTTVPNTTVPTTDEPTTTAQDAIVATAENPEHEPTLRQLHNREQYWAWKASLRSVICVVNLVAIGCAAWVLARPSVVDTNPYLYNFQFNDGAVGAIIVLGISFLWSLFWIVLPVVLKPPRPLHPGIAVGFDLLLWLGFLVVALFSVAGLVSIQEFGAGGSLDDPNQPYNQNNYQGDYYLASNGTWVYNITDTDYDYDHYTYNPVTGEYEYDTYDPSTIVRDCTPEFATCAEKDDYINALWREKPKRFAIQVVISVVEWLDMLLHFALFVWACVDTHRHNRKRLASQEQVMADKIITDLEKRGLIAVQNGVFTRVNPATTQPQTSQQPFITSPPPAQLSQQDQSGKEDATTQSARWA